MELNRKCHKVHEAIMAESKAKAEAIAKAVEASKSGRRR